MKNKLTSIIAGTILGTTALVGFSRCKEKTQEVAVPTEQKVVNYGLKSCNDSIPINYDKFDLIFQKDSCYCFVGISGKTTEDFCTTIYDMKSAPKEVRDKLGEAISSYWDGYELENEHLSFE